MRNRKLQHFIDRFGGLQSFFSCLLLTILTSMPGSSPYAAIRTWNGAGAGAGTSVLNLPSNWSGGTALLATDDLVINISNTNTYTLSLSGDLSVNSISITTSVPVPASGRSLTVTLGSFNLTTTGNFTVTNSSTSSQNNRTYDITILIPAAKTLSIGGNLNCSISNTSTNVNQITFTNSGAMIVNGTTTANSLNVGTASKVSFNVDASPASYSFNGNVTLDDGTTTTNSLIGIGSTAPGTTGSFKFNADLSLGACTFTNTDFTLGTVVFDRAGTQTITFNNSTYFFKVPNLIIGNVNNPSLVLAGSVVPDNITGNFTINGSSVVNLNTRQWNRHTNGGTFTMNATSKLQLGAAASVANFGIETLVNGSNFPSGFSTISLAAGSTVEYNSANSVNQTVYAPVTYGNLVLTNGTGTGASVKLLSANITGIAGNLTINTFTTLDQSSYTANRNTAGGVFTLNANGYWKIAGASSGQPGSNFPLNFSSIVLNAASTVEYTSLAGVNQTIYAPVLYGNLILTNASGSGNSVKTLAANMTGIAGDLTINPYATFDQVGFAANRNSAGGTLTANANATLKIAGASGGQLGSNFPLNFSTISLNAASTTEYNSGSGITQTVYAPVTYGNLVLSNITGSGSSNKILTANANGIAGNLTVNSFTTFDQSTYSINRTTAGGIFSMTANSTHKIAGTSGGQTGSNFPLNFTSVVIDPTAITEYNSVAGTNQTIYGLITYGNLILTNSTGSGNSSKLLTANITGIAGNLVTNSFVTFDQSTFTANRSTVGGAFTLNANAIHRIAGSAGGQAGSNFPLNFSSVVLNSASTTEYNSLSGVNQTVYVAVNYGNLIITNGTGSGNSTKFLTGNISGIAGNLTVNSFATFDQTTFTANRNSAGGMITLAANSSLKLAAGSGGEAGSNYPANFSTQSLNSLSTVEYNSANTINQTVFPTPVYGNLTLTNSSGAGSSIKKLTANMGGVASDVTINPFSTFDLATFTANRSVAGGSLAIAANANLKLAGSTGGQTGSNFPSGFATITINDVAGTEYYGADQSIYQVPNYGHLSLSGTGTKTAPTGNLVIRGDLAKTTNTVFAHNNGTVIFSGTAANQVYGSVAPVMSFFNFTNNNTSAGAGLKINSGVAVEAELQLAASSKLTLSDNQVFALKSSLSRTANLAAVPASASISYLGSGSFSVERYISTGVNHAKSWQLLAAPTNGQTIRESWMEAGLSTTTPNSYGTTITGAGGAANGFDLNTATPSMKYYNSATDAWVGVTRPDTSHINLRRGYLVFVRGDRSVFSFSGANSAANPTVLRTKGTLNIGTQTSIPIAQNAFELIGNPYPSPVDFSLITQTGISNSFMVWDASLYGSYGLGAYQTISKVGTKWLATPGSLPLAGVTPLYNATSDYRYIQSGEAFFVKGLTTVNNITFAENQKAAAANGMLLNRGSGVADPATDPVMLSTSLLAIVNGNPIMADGNRVLFGNEFSNAVDQDDAVKLTNGGENFGISCDGQKLAVETRAAVNVTDTIHYSMSNLKQQPYKLMFAPAGMDVSVRATLIDNWLKTSTPVSLFDTSYVTINITSDVLSQASNRFIMVFNKVITTTLPVNIVSISASRNNDGSIGLHWKVENEINISSYDIERSADGKHFSNILTADATAVNGSSASYEKSDINPLSSFNYYRIRANGNDGKVQYSVIVRVSPVITAASMGVFPNPVTSKTARLRFVNQAAGIYSVQVNNQAGQVIYKGEAKVTGADVLKVISLGKTIPAAVYQLIVTDSLGKKFTQQLFVE